MGNSQENSGLNSKLFMPTLKMPFNEDLIRWMNLNFSERNWFYQGSFFFHAIEDYFVPKQRSLHLEEMELKILSTVEDKVFTKLSSGFDPVQMFWEQRGQTEMSFYIDPSAVEDHEECLDKFKAFTEAICISIMRITNAKNIYLNRIQGFLEYQGDGTVQPTWFLVGYFDTEAKQC
jgi:hypothetical protein